ncbi:MAG: ribosome maturation factor RimM [Muribaculaceae bacterium]|nr:ribosome maturation factor RimM [Muribaculaceae bacterium]
MITKEEIVEIGKFQKTHALKGELNAILDVDVDYAEEDYPMIVDVDGIYVPFYVNSIRPKGTETYLISLEGVDSQEDAKEFVNKTIYGLRKDVGEYFETEDLDLASDFVGYELVDSEFGKVGKVIGVDDSTANVLFIVETPDGNTVYVPVAEEFIMNIDDEARRIATSLPEGLINLNS